MKGIPHTFKLWIVLLACTPLHGAGCRGPSQPKPADPVQEGAEEPLVDPLDGVHFRFVVAVERCFVGRFDVDDPIWRVRMQPVDTPRPLRDADELGDRHLLVVIEDHEVLMDVNALSFLRVAGDAVDRLSDRLTSRR